MGPGTQTSETLPRTKECEELSTVDQGKASGWQGNFAGVRIILHLALEALQMNALNTSGSHTSLLIIISITIYIVILEPA